MILPKIHVYDLDGTLVRCNSFHLWIKFLAGLLVKRPLAMIALGTALAARALRIINHAEMKRRVLLLSTHATVEDVKRFCAYLERSIHTEVMSRLASDKQDNGIITCLNTAAPQLYAEPFGKCLGFHLIIATPMPRPGWQENLGERKLRALEEQQGNIFYNEIGAVFTDELADLPLMMRAQKVYLVAPKAKVYKEVAAQLSDVELIP